MSLSTVINDGLDYQAQDITNEMEAFGVVGGGVGDLAAGHFQVTQNGTPNKTVNVTVGFAWVPNSSHSTGSGIKFWPVRSSGVENVTIPDNASGNPRIDRICIKINTGATAGIRGTGSVSVICVTGTAAASPTAPATPNDHLSLAFIAVANGFSSITNSNITDDRLQATLSRRGGWESAGETLVYTVTTAPIYIAYVSGDRTAKYSQGMKWKLTQGTVTTPLFFKTAHITYTNPNTLIYMYGGTDYTMSNATIATAYYSMENSPAGFPVSPSKWTTRYTGTANVTGGTATNIWYNPGTANLAVPIGPWRLSYAVYAFATKAAAGTFDWQVALSTTVSTATDNDFMNRDYSTPSLTAKASTFIKEKSIVNTVTTTYHLIGRNIDATAFSSFSFLGSGGNPVEIKAVFDA